jgi:hypothetical protein
MLPEFSKLIEEFELLSLDDKAFFSFANHSELEVSVMYVRAEGTQPWTLWFNLSQEPSKQRVSKLFLEEAVRGFELDTRELARQVADRLLTQAAYADEMVRKVGALLGQEALRESIRSTQEFMESLQSMVTNLLGDKTEQESDKKPVGLDTFRKDQAKASGTKPNHLRIVKA